MPYTGSARLRRLQRSTLPHPTNQRSRDRNTTAQHSAPRLAQGCCLGQQLVANLGLQGDCVLEALNVDASPGSGLNRVPEVLKRRMQGVGAVLDRGRDPQAQQVAALVKVLQRQAGGRVGRAGR